MLDRSGWQLQCGTGNTILDERFRTFYRACASGALSEARAVIKKTEILIKDDVAQTVVFDRLDELDDAYRHLWRLQQAENFVEGRSFDHSYIQHL